MLPNRIPPLFYLSDVGEYALDAITTSSEVAVSSVDMIPPSMGLLNAGEALKQVVYIRAAWEDEWQLAPYLHCDRVTWSCAPTIPSAQLTWDYGALSREDAINNPRLTAPTLPRDLDRWYVRIVIDTEPFAYLDSEGDLVRETTREWVGVIRFCEHQPSGDIANGDELIAGGHQVFTAYGMEQMLAETFVLSSVWQLTAPAGDEGEEQRTYATWPFNPLRRGRQTGNRSETKINGAYVFSRDPATSEKWTHADIAEYLIWWFNPPDRTGSWKVTFRIDPAELDRVISVEPPELDPTGQTVYALLCRMIDRRRLVCWWAEYDAEENHVVIKTETMTDTNVVLPIAGSPMIPRNERRKRIYANMDPATTWADRWPASDPCDQVIVRGARRLSVGTFSFEEGTLEKGWSAAQETKYNKGASEEAGYGDLDTDEKQRRNTEARSRPEVAAVHAQFRIPKTWNWQTGDGAGGGSYSATFPSDVGSSLPVNYREMFVQQNLPLKEGVDYEDLTEPPSETNATGKLLPPLVVLKRPKKDEEDEEEETRWVMAHKVGMNANLETKHRKANERFSAHVEVPEQYQGFVLKVLGQPQHVLAKYYFTDPLPVDEKVGDWDYYSGMRATLAVPDDRYCEGVYPESSLVPDLDLVRIKLIEHGERFRKDYLVPNTIVDVDTAGELVHSTGGFLPAETDDDDEHQLLALAKIAYQWYGRRHHVVALDSFRIKPKAALGIGDMITTIGSPPLEDDSVSANTLDVKTVISQISVTIPKGLPRDGAAPRPQMSITTWCGELEPEPVQPAPLSGVASPYFGPAAPSPLTAAQHRDMRNDVMRRLGREFSSALKGSK